MPIDDIFEIDSLDELTAYLQSLPPGRTRQQLRKRFFENVRYQNLSQWNRTVRLCEALTIVGWGDLEPVQAIRTIFDNGCPWTELRNRYWDYRYIDAWWSKRKDGIMMSERYLRDHGSDDLPARLLRKPFVATFEKEHGSFATQRNWIPRSPICVWRAICNCYESSEAFMASTKKLDAKLHLEMRPEVYGREIDQLRFYTHVSYGEPLCTNHNFVIQEDDKKLSADEQRRRLRESCC